MIITVLLLLFADDTTTIFSSDPVSAVRFMISFVEPFDWFASNKLSLDNYTTQTINFSLYCDLVRYATVKSC